MSNMDKVFTISEAGSQELDTFMSEVRTLVETGLTHGWYEVVISMSVGKNNRREIFVKAIKSDKYTIRMGELPR